VALLGGLVAVLGVAVAVPGRVPAMGQADIIACRELEQDGRKYQVLIEKPSMGETGDFECRWSLVDDSGVTVASQRMYGVDSVQALLSAFLVIGERIEVESNRFTHLGMVGTGLLRPLASDRTDISTWFLSRNNT
jgi:hypothetical protein